MKLFVHERLHAIGLLPEQGDFLTLKVVREAREMLSFTEAEHEEFQFEQEEGAVRWKNPENPEDLQRDIPLGKKARALIAEALEKKNEEKELTEQFFSLYEKFCVEDT